MFVHTILHHIVESLIDFSWIWIFWHLKMANSCSRVGTFPKSTDILKWATFLSSINIFIRNSSIHCVCWIFVHWYKIRNKRMHGTSTRQWHIQAEIFIYDKIKVLVEPNNLHSCNQYYFSFGWPNILTFRLQIWALCNQMVCAHWIGDDKQLERDKWIERNCSFYFNFKALSKQARDE